MKVIRFVVVCAAVLCAASSAYAQATLKGATIQFATTNDDKDWNTQIIARIVINGNDAGTLQCCSSDHNIDHFNNNTTTSRALTMVGTAPTKDAAQHGLLVIGEKPVGNDTWVFNPTLILTFSDGTSIQKTFPQSILAGTHSNYTENKWNW